MGRLEANGTTIAYARTGTGPPILLMHGAEADHSLFAPLAAELEQRLAVIAYDQRDSGDARNPGEPYTLEDMGDDAATAVPGRIEPHLMSASAGNGRRPLLCACSYRRTGIHFAGTCFRQMKPGN